MCWRECWACCALLVLACAEQGAAGDHGAATAAVPSDAVGAGSQISNIRPGTDTSASEFATGVGPSAPPSGMQSSVTSSTGTPTAQSPSAQSSPSLASGNELPRSQDVAPDGSESGAPSAGAMPPPDSAIADGGTELGSPGQAATNDGAPSTSAEATDAGGQPPMTTRDAGLQSGDEAAPFPSRLGSGQMQGSGESSAPFQTATVSRDGVAYEFKANGWGPGFDSHVVSWSGTSFTVERLQGEQGPEREAAGFPAVLCGQYSDSCSSQSPVQQWCGLPRALSELSEVRTGMRWTAAGSGQYSAALDIWFGDSGNGACVPGGAASGFLMVWLRQPSGQTPRGELVATAVTDVSGLPGAWDIWSGVVRGTPITNYVRRVGEDASEIEFDALSLVADATARGLMVPGDTLLGIAAGFSVWNGPVEGLACEDFYVEAAAN